MKLEQIDKNFANQDVEVQAGEAVYTIPHRCFSLYGVFYDTENAYFTRVPNAVASATSPNVAHLARNTAGGRLCFQTDATFLRLTVTYPGLCNMRHMPLTGSSGFSLFEDTPQGEKIVGILAPEAHEKQGFSNIVKLKGGLRNYVLYFPLYNDVKELKISLDEHATVHPYAPYQNVFPIVYYGSSITQGGCASRPDQSYQSLICKKNRIDYINLGFSGSACGELPMVEYFSNLPCSLFVCDYDHNAPTCAHLEETHYPLYQHFRQCNPDTPILFVTRPDYKTADDEKRLEIVYNTYQNAKSSGDENVYFLSGKTFFEGGQVCDYTVDNVHPTSQGFALMAEKIYQKMQEISTIFQGEKR